MRSCEPRFARLLSPFSEQALESHHGSIYGLWPDLTLAYLNPAWFEFADQNRAPADFHSRWAIGNSILPALAGPLEDFYTAALTECLATMECWDHEYECPSPNDYRKFRMRVYPFRDRAGLLVVNTLTIHRPHSVQVFARGGIDEYRDQSGIALMCMHCRRFRRCTSDRTGEAWDWVAEWVDTMPAQVSHGLCPICFEYHFPHQDSSER